MRRCVVFDFDGTLVNTVDILHEIYNDLAAEKGWQKLTLDQYKKLFTASIWQAFVWAKFMPWRLYILINESRNRLHDKPEKAQLYEGIDEVIASLSKNDWDIYVLSRNRRDTVKLILKEKGLDMLPVLEKAPFFRKHIKVKKLMNEKGYTNNNIWMVGDEVRDVKASKKVRVKCIAVTWGFHNELTLYKSGPDFIVKTPKDILKIIV